MADWRRDLVIRKLPPVAVHGSGVNSLDASDLVELEKAVAQMGGNGLKETSESGQQGRGNNMVELTLQQSVEIALRHNLGIQAEALSRDSFQTRIPQAQALFHPTVGASLSATGERIAPQALSLPFDINETQEAAAFITQPLPTGTGALLGVTSRLFRSDSLVAQDPGTREFTGEVEVAVSQPLLRGVGIVVATKPIRDAEYDLHVQEADLRAFTLRVIADTKNAYYRMLRAEETIEVTKQAIERNRALKETSEALYAAGLVTLRDVLSAEIDLADDQSRLAVNEGQLQLARNNLLDVLGIRIDTEVALLDRDISFQAIPLELDTWIEVALKNRPEIVRIEQELAKNALRIRTGKNTTLPQLDVFGAYKRFSTSQTSGSSFDLDSESWSAGLIFSVPIGNVQRRSQLAEARIDQARLVRELVQQQRRIRLEVRDAVITLRRSVAAIKALQVKMEQSRGKLETARTRFALGIANNLDISDAQKDLRDAQTDLLAAIIDYNIGLAELEARIASPIGHTSDQKASGAG